MRQLLQEHRDAILEIARRHGASDVRLFGSVARGDAIPTSDVDVLVRFEPGRSLFDHAALIGDLEDLLGVSVDVVDEGGMAPRFRSVVTREAIPL
jgi:hypothetical protein